MRKAVFRVEGKMAAVFQRLSDLSGDNPDVIEEFIKTLERRNSVDDAMLMSTYILSLEQRLEGRVMPVKLARLAGIFFEFSKRRKPNRQSLARVGTFRSTVNSSELIWWATKSVSGKDPQFPGIGPTIMRRVVECMLDDGVLLN